MQLTNWLVACFSGLMRRTRQIQDGHCTLNINALPGWLQKWTVANSLGGRNPLQPRMRISVPRRTEPLEIRALLSTLPVLESINRANSANALTNASSVSFTATFNETVTGVNSSDFQLVETGAIGATGITVTPVSGSVYTVSANGIFGNGTIGVNIVYNNSIHDLAGDTLTQPVPSTSFANPVTYATGNQPLVDSVTLGDVNGDGKPDLVVANYGSGSVSVLLGNGNGTFQSQQTFATGTSCPRSVKLGDVNGDGKPDVIVGNGGTTGASIGYDDNSVSVLLGNGNGTFQSPLTFAARTSPVSVTLGDVNGDGKLDAAVVNSVVSDTVSVFLGNGNGTFQLPQTFATGETPFQVNLSDVNGDGKLDLVVANVDAGSVSVLLGNGNGTFQPQQTFQTEAGPRTVSLGDMNGDGKPDLVVADSTYGGGCVSVLLGNGDGTFQPQQTFAIVSRSYGVTTSDVNGDGKLDVIDTGGGGFVTVLLGNGNGTFQSRQTFAMGGDSTTISDSVTSGDVNGDGKPDIIVANYNSVSVLLNTSPSATSFMPQTYTEDQTAPTVQSITAATASPATGSSGQFTVTFSTAVSGVTTGAFSLAESGVTGGTVSSISGSGTTYTVSVTGLSGSGTVALNLTTVAGIADLATNALATGFTSNPLAYTSVITFLQSGALVQLSGSTLTVNGTVGNDTLAVSEGTSLVATLNTVNYVFNPTAVATINSTASTGNDTTTVNSLNAATTFSSTSGSGNDAVTINAAVASSITLVGGAGNDTLTGGSGKNVISTGSGANKVMLVVPTIASAKDTLTSSGSANVLNLQAFTDGLTFSLAKGSGTAQTADPNNGFLLDIQSNAFKSVILGGNAGTMNVVTGNTTLATKIVGGSGDNTIAGGAGNDLLIGGLGNSLLTDGNGSDTLYGGNNNNTLIAGNGSNTLYGGTANNVISTGSGANKVILAAPTIANVIDILTSSGSANVLNLQAFTDGLTFSLAKGSGVSQTADSNNSFQLDVQNNAFKSVLLGGNAGTTNIVTGNTTLGTRIVGGSGNNTITGGSGNDFLAGGLGNSLLTDGNGADTLAGGSGNSTLNGGSGGDLFITGGANNVISAGKGANRLQISVPTVANSKDTVTDSSTADILNISAFTDGLTFSLAKGFGVAQVADPTTGFILDVPNGSFNNVLLGGNAGTTNVVTGNSTLGTKIVGGSGNNTIAGGSGNDFLVGGLGNSLLTDGSGADSLIGGGGNSTLTAGNGGDTFVTGDASNVVTTGSGSNRMIVSIPEFANSKDTITDSSTNDILYLNAFTDGLTFSLAKGSGVAQLADPNNGFTLDLPDGAFFFVLLGGLAGTTNVVTGNSVAATRIYGGNNNNTITGGSGADYLTGGLGNCLLTDSAGNASLFGGGGNSTLIGGIGNDTLVAGLGTNVMTAGNGNDIFYAGIGNTTMTGGSGNDTFYGSSGNVTMNGGSGGDLFVSGTANNVISAGSGKNRIQLSVPKIANSKDTITDTSTSDILNLTAFTDGLTFSLAKGSGVAQVADPNNGFTLDIPNGAFNNVLLGGSALTTNEVIGNSTLGTAIYGGAGNNILVGGNGNDSLYGGSGRDILVGGGGVGIDLLQSGVGGQGILIDGTINFANPLTSLMAIENEWASTDSYANRIADIRASGKPGLNLNGSNNLTISSGTPTITLGTTRNRLLGGGANDWFWVNASDATNWAAGETLD